MSDVQDEDIASVEKISLHDNTSGSSNGHVNGHFMTAPSSSSNNGNGVNLTDEDKKSVNSGSQRSTPRSGSNAGSSSTKVYYHIDDEQVPYVTDVPVTPERITLFDFKQMLNKTNFKFYCKSNDPEVGGEVKAEIRDDNQRLFKSINGQFELFLLTTDGSNNSDAASSGFSRNIRQMVPGPAPQSYPFNMAQHLRNFPGFDHGHRRRQFEDSTVCTESDARVFSDEESRVSTSTDNITSVSRQHNNYRVRQRRVRRHLRQPSRASSMSSMTETSMSLEVMTVTLNMDSVNFLGISIVGQSSTGGDNGIYVANIMKGGAVALDGRIEPGDMILQVNEVSFENFTNDQAVEVLKDAVSKRGPIKLTVAKSWDPSRQDYFSLPSKEPVRPIDMRAWIQHTNAARNLPHIPEGSEGAPTPIPGHYPNYGRAHSSSTATSNGSGGQQTIVGPNGQMFILPKKLDTATDKKRVVWAMALPNSGLDIKDRTWLKILIPMSFLGSDLVDWLIEHVDGLDDRKDSKKYATDLLKEGYITHMVNSNKFNEQSYYMVGNECADVIRLRLSDDGGVSRTDMNMLPAPPPHIQQNWGNMNSDYVPISPFPMHYQRGPDMYSQISGHSNGDSSGSEHRRAKAILPPAPSSIVPYNAGAQFFRQQSARMVDFRAASRQSFRIACGNQTSEEFFIDHV